MKVTYLGPTGTFTESAAKGFFKLTDTTKFTPLASVPRVLESVSEGIADWGVVPMENSIQGTVHATIDSLLKFPDISIAKELMVPIQQDLLMKPDGQVQRIKEVWSHPQALAQCGWLTRQLGALEVEYKSTAAAAEALAEINRLDVAVIASGRNANQLGLIVVRKNIAEVDVNFTRFAVIAKMKNQTSVPLQTEPCKTMLVVMPANDNTGVLASILSVFATLGHNLSWIESRPTRIQMGAYQFFLEIQSHLSLDRTQQALAVLRAFGHEVRCLGCYSVYQVGTA